MNNDQSLVTSSSMVPPMNLGSVSAPSPQANVNTSEISSSTIRKVAGVALATIVGVGVVLAAVAVTAALMTNRPASALIAPIAGLAVGALGGLVVAKLVDKDLGEYGNKMMHLMGKGLKGMNKALGYQELSAAASNPSDSVNPVNVLEGHRRVTAETVNSKAQFSNEFTEINQWHEGVKALFVSAEGDLVRCQGPKGEPDLSCERKQSTTGVTTYNYFTGEGSKRKVLYSFNEFPDGECYNGAMQQDFIDRLNLVFDAAELGLRSQPFEDDALIALNNHREVFAEQLRELDRPEGLSLDPAGSELFDEIYDKAVEIIKNAIVEASTLLSDAGVTEKLKRLEAKFVGEQGRPILVNTFTIPGSDTKIVNIHKPLVDKMLPSTIRTGSLANALHNLSGYIERDGKVVITSEAFRHTSTPPIAESNEYKRLRGGVNNARQIVQALAETKIDAEAIPGDNGPNNPIELDWNVMMLVTPKTVDVLRGYVSESRMLKEQLENVNALAGHPILVEVKGKPVFVKINVSMMNLGVNIPSISAKFLTKPLDKALAMLPESELLGEQNAQGYLEFEIQTDNFIHSAILKHAGEDKDFAELLTQYGKCKNHEINHEFFKYKNKLEARLVEKRKALVAELEKDTFSTSRIDELRADIKGIESKIREKAVFFAAKKVEFCKKNENELSELRGKIIEKLDVKISDLNTDPKVKKELLAAKRVLMNQSMFTRMYADKYYRNPQTALLCQAVYVDTMSLMDSGVSTNCKSGEDRTGIICLAVDAISAMRALGHEIPKLDRAPHELSEEDKAQLELFKSIICRLIDTSPGTYTNAYNAIGSRGFQITEMIVPPEKQTQIRWQTKISKLAKNCYVQHAQQSQKKREYEKIGFESVSDSVIDDDSAEFSDQEYVGGDAFDPLSELVNRGGGSVVND